MTIFQLCEIIQEFSLNTRRRSWFIGFHLRCPHLSSVITSFTGNPPRSMNDPGAHVNRTDASFFPDTFVLSEPNVNLLFPFMLICCRAGQGRQARFFTFCGHTVCIHDVEWSFPQLFFLVYPSVLDSLMQIDLHFGTASLRLDSPSLFFGH